MLFVSVPCSLERLCTDMHNGVLFIAMHAVFNFGDTNRTFRPPFQLQNLPCAAIVWFKHEGWANTRGVQFFGLGYIRTSVVPCLNTQKPDLGAG